MMSKVLWIFLCAAVLEAQPGDLRGLWKAESKAYLNLETAGVIFDPPSGKIPYQPEARTQAAENFARRANADPDARCFQPGVPRATLMPYPFQILENDRAVYIVYERVHSYRILYLDGKPHNNGLPYAMGDSRAHWEGSTLVADVSSFSDRPGWMRPVIITAISCMSWSDIHGRVRKPSLTRPPSRTPRFLPCPGSFG